MSNAPAPHPSRTPERTGAQHASAAAGSGIAVLYAQARERAGRRYEQAAWLAATERLAALKGFAFGGTWRPTSVCAGATYFVPNETLERDAAEALGIASEDDLFGGVVPHAFVGTKAITQPLLHADAAAPRGWSNAFHDALPDAVLRGHAAFTLEDAREAGRRLLAHGPVRVKPAFATGGRGQYVVRDADALDRAVLCLRDEGLVREGLLLEENLEDVVTHSVGCVRVGELVASYHGTQHETRDHAGHSAYGGSTLTVVRGDYEALLALDLAEDARLAVRQARAYDARARECFPGLLASRSNYDVAQGTDARGMRRSGVLEQSWRIGGATPAELVALEAFASDPSLRAVRACCRERYGEAPREGAQVFFAGEDPDVGAITLYAWAEPLEGCAPS